MIGGWGTTRYAEEQQRTIPLGGNQVHYVLWADSETGFETVLAPVCRIYAGGVVGMAVGAGLIGLAWFPIDKQKQDLKDTDDV